MLAIFPVLYYNSLVNAGVLELVDEADSKSAAGDSVPVRARSPAPAFEPANMGSPHICGFFPVFRPLFFGCFLLSLCFYRNVPPFLNRFGGTFLFGRKQFRIASAKAIRRSAKHSRRQSRLFLQISGLCGEAVDPC